MVYGLVIVIVAVIGAITGIISLIISVYFSKKVMNQTDRNLKIQLIYEDKKQALDKLQKLAETVVTWRNFESYKKSIKQFFNSTQGTFVPKDVATDVLKHLNKLEEYEYKNDPTIDHSQDDKEPPEYEDYDLTEGMDIFQKYEHNLKDGIVSFEASVDKSVKSGLEEL
jgi:hypothetical protein